MLFPSHSITPCGEINSLAPCGGKQFPGNLEDETGMQSLFALSQHQPYGESLPRNTQKSDGYAVAFSPCRKAATKTILSSLFPIHCAKQPLSGTQEIKETLPSPASLKGGGVCGGNLWFPTTFERSGIPPAGVGLQSKPPAALSQRLKVAVWRSFPHAGDTSPGWAVPFGLPPQSGPAVRAV